MCFAISDDANRHTSTLGMWFSGDYGGATLMVGLHDLEDLFQT